MKAFPLLIVAALLFIFSVPLPAESVAPAPADSKLRMTARYYRCYAPVGTVEEAIELNLKETAFLLVDVYGKEYDLPPVRGKGKNGRPSNAELSWEALVRYAVPARAAAKKAGLPIIYICNYLAPRTTEQTEFRNLSLRSYGVDVLKLWKEPTDLFAYSKIIAPEKGDYEIKKQMYSGFFETGLDSLLKSLGAKNLILVGFDFRICLGNTVTDALYRDYRVVVLRDCGRTSEFPETEEGGWANFLAVRFIEKNVGYTALAGDFIRGLEAVRNGR